LLYFWILKLRLGRRLLLLALGSWSLVADASFLIALPDLLGRCILFLVLFHAWYGCLGLIVFLLFEERGFNGQLLTILLLCV